MFLCHVMTFIVPSGDIYLSVASCPSWYVLFGNFDDCRGELAPSIVYIRSVWAWTFASVFGKVIPVSFAEVPTQNWGTWSLLDESIVCDYSWATLIT